MKTIEFNKEKYKLKKFTYFSGRLGLLLTKESNNTSLSATLDIDSISVQLNQIIVKSHDLNEGMLETLMDNGIIKKQAIPITLGFNKVYVCKLN